MAPEQAEGQRPGPAADVYSRALTLYEGLCGEHPRIGDGPAATARAIDEPVPPLADVRPDLPQPLTDAIDASLDPDPELRPLASELEGVLASHEDELDGTRLPAVLRPSEPDEPRLRRSLPAADRDRADGGKIACLALHGCSWDPVHSAPLWWQPSSPSDAGPLRTRAMTRALWRGGLPGWPPTISGATSCSVPKPRPRGWEQSVTTRFGSSSCLARCWLAPGLGRSRGDAAAAGSRQVPVSTRSALIWGLP
jgi:hypothetical protein